MSQNLAFNFDPFDLQEGFRAELVQTMKPFDRGWLADEIGKLANCECSKETIDRWASDRNAPGFLIPTICEISQNPALHRFIERPILALLNKTRFEELSKVEAQLRILHARKAALEGHQ